jgi:glucose/mannose-6-phosphate isomerase
MLDDLKLIHERDAQDALGFAEKQWQQLLFRYEVKIPQNWQIDNIVWAGMGGSALPAQFCLNWLGAPKPFNICRDYEVPEYVNKNTLFIGASYSGNTEETLGALTHAEAKKANIVIFTTGGELAKRANANGYPLYLIPIYAQPRMTNLFFIKGLAHLYEQLGLGKNLSEQLEAAAEGLKTALLEWRPDVHTKNNPAKKLALELVGKSVVVYGGPKMGVVANKFKIALNESAKNVAWYNQLPEFNHNEFTGWSGQPLDKPYAVVDIRSNLEHPRVQKRFELTERLLSGKRPAPNIIEPKGKTLINQLLWGLIFSDFVAIYLAILNGINPTSLELNDKFKAELNK